MADTLRLTGQICHSFIDLLEMMERHDRDGVVDRVERWTERARISVLWWKAEVADYVKAEAEFREKLGPDAPLHYYLIRKKHDLDALRAKLVELGYLPLPPTATAPRWKATVKRKSRRPASVEQTFGQKSCVGRNR